MMPDMAACLSTFRQTIHEIGSAEHYEIEADVLGRQEGCNPVGGEKRVRLASEVVGPISTLLGDFGNVLDYEITVQGGKEDVVIGVSLVPVACRVVC
jgi:hypothetical protein